MAATPPAAAGYPKMGEALRAAAGPSGRVRYDRFIETALYAAGVGYYARPEATIGPRGDFYTAAHVSPLFGATLAARAIRAWKEAGSPATFQVVELGPGDGTLARDFLAALARYPPGGSRWEYVLCERSATLRERARTATEGIGRVRAVAALGELAPVRGFVFANELLDAQPARRFVRQGSRWVELGVDVGTDRPVQVELTGEQSGPIPALPDPAVDGAVYETSLRAEAIVRDIADHLEAGAAVLLDYGAEDGYWTETRSRGTLEAHRGHRTSPDPLEDPGASDLSVWVNFTRIRRSARAAGLRELAFRRQSEALASWGYEPLLSEWLAAAEDPAERVRRQLASKNLLFGFERFYALELAPGTTTR